MNNKTGVITVADCPTPGSKNCLDFETKQTYYLTYKVCTALSSSRQPVPEIMCAVTQGSITWFMDFAGYTFILPGCWQVLSPTRKETSYSDQTQTFASHSKKKKNSEACPSNQVSVAAMTSASDEKWRPFNCFFGRVGLRTYQHPCMCVIFKFPVKLHYYTHILTLFIILCWLTAGFRHRLFCHYQMKVQYHYFICQLSAVTSHWHLYCINVTNSDNCPYTQQSSSKNEKL